MTKTKLGYQCSLCSVKKLFSNEMFAHIRTKHSKDEVITIEDQNDNFTRKCLYCEKILDSCSPKYFLKHVNSCMNFSELAKKTSNTCQFCSKQFNKSHLLFGHIRNKHSSEPEFVKNQMKPREKLENFGSLIQEDFNIRSEIKIEEVNIESS